MKKLSIRWADTGVMLTRRELIALHGVLITHVSREEILIHFAGKHVVVSSGACLRCDDDEITQRVPVIKIRRRKKK